MSLPRKTAPLTAAEIITADLAALSADDARLQQITDLAVVLQRACRFHSTQNVGATIQALAQNELRLIVRPAIRHTARQADIEGLDIRGEVTS